MSSPAPPLCHSSEAYHLKRFIKTGILKATKCNVFKGEDLSYLFVGRPAFKRQLDAEAEYWELPICIIINFKSVKPKRIFPFDSGAFASHRYPSFIDMMDIEEFDAASDLNATEKIIGTFFVNSRNYFNLKARPSASFENMFDVEVLDEEIRALHRLIGFKNDKSDDRRFSIEFQYDRDLALNPDTVLAIIVPETYLESEEVIDYVTERLKAKLLSYPVFPLKKDYYYFAIYQIVERFMKSGGYFNV